MLEYTVLVRPKGPVPILALEWRIREDVPVNLLAVKETVERLGGNMNSSKRRRLGGGTGKSDDDDKGDSTMESRRSEGIGDWGDDETLGQYIY